MSTPHNYQPNFRLRALDEDTQLYRVYSVYKKHGRLAMKQAVQLFGNMYPDHGWDISSEVSNLYLLGYLDRDDKSPWQCPKTKRKSSVFFIPEVENHPMIGLLRQEKRVIESEENNKLKKQQILSGMQVIVDGTKKSNDEMVRFEEALIKFNKEV